jgi:dihydroorotate dehydrogenase electron transfer subunit
MTHGELQAQAGPVQVRGTVLTVRPVDAYYAMTLVAPAIAARFRPGQFITLAVGGPDTSMMLSRAFSIHDVRPDHGGTVEFVFAVQGRGTQWLAERRARDVLDVTGPLGRPFPLPRDAANCLLVGGGYGSAPLFALAARLRERGCEVDFLLGASTGDRIFGALTARRTGRSAAITTEDGSLGSRGLVTDLLDQAIHDGRTDVIYACGPMPMLRQITVLARRYEIPVQVAVEEAMACGVGVCMTCVLPVIGSDGITRMSRSCVDGPVYRGEQVRWDDIGTIPFDAFGAPGWEPRAHRAAQVQSRDGQAADGQAGNGPPADGHAADGPAVPGPAVSPDSPLGAQGSADGAPGGRSAARRQQDQPAAAGQPELPVADVTGMSAMAGPQGEPALADGTGRLAATAPAGGPARGSEQGGDAGAGAVGARGGGARGRGARRQGHGG